MGYWELPAIVNFIDLQNFSLIHKRKPSQSSSKVIQLHVGRQHALAGTVGVAPFRSPKIFVNDCVSGMVYLTIKRTKNIVVNFFCDF